MKKQLFSRNIPTYFFIFLIGYVLGGIMIWNNRKKIEKEIKNHKQREKEVGHPTLTIHRLKDQGIFPIKWHKPGEVPKHSIRIFPPLHAGGRPEGTPYDEIDQQVIDLLQSGDAIEIIKTIKTYLPDYKKKYQAANPEVKLFKSDDNLIIDSARKRIIKSLEKTKL